MKKLVIVVLGGCMVVLQLTAQQSYIRYDSIPVIDGVDTLVDKAWAGGFNAPQFSPIDLNDDGIDDLFVFDRDGFTVKTFLNKGTPNVPAYYHAPQYEDIFPDDLMHFTLLRDYNCDGYVDIYTGSIGGMAVYRNEFATNGQHSWTKVTSLLLSDYPPMVNLYVPTTDIPSIVDMDEDGDLDILTFGVIGTAIEYHINMSQENGYGCDSLIYERATACWGYIAENSLNNSISLGISCKTAPASGRPAISSAAHSGSTILALDLDNDTVKDAVLGDISFNNMVKVCNGGTLSWDTIVAYDTLFPSNNISTIPVNLPLFPAGYHMDINNDGIRDLLVAPNTPNASENFTGVWYYRNDSIDLLPAFNFIENDFIQTDMIEVGSDAHPCFFDASGDGLLDLLIGNYGYYNTSGVYDGRIAYFENVGTAANPQFELITRDYANLSVLGYNALYPTFGDLDNDGDGDMILGDFTGYVHYFENTAGAGNPAAFVLAQPQLANWDVGQHAAPFLVDADMDNDLDLIVGERSGNLNYLENSGTASVKDFLSSIPDDQFGQVDVLVPCCTGYSTPFLASLDSTGERYLAVGSERGTIYFYNDVDSNLQGTFILIDSIVTSGYQISVSGADINNDGTIELVYGQSAGGVSVLKKDQPIGLHDLPPSLPVSLYPNPASKSLTISFSAFEDGLVSITDILGRIVHNPTPVTRGTVTIDISNLPSGVYMVGVETKRQLATRKFIKQ